MALGAGRVQSTLEPEPINDQAEPSFTWLRALSPVNIEVISVTLEVAKAERSREVRAEQA